MKKTWLMSVAMIAMLAPGAHAAAGATWLGVNGGICMPFGDFADAASTGFNLGVTGDYMQTDQWAFGGELAWHSFGGNDDLEKRESALLGVPVEINIRAIPITGHVKYLLPTSGDVAPFVKGALGLYNLRSEVDAGIQGSDSNSETKLGFQVGGGLNFTSTAAYAYGAEVMFHYIATEGQASNMITLRGQLMFGLQGQ